MGTPLPSRFSESGQEAVLLLAINQNLTHSKASTFRSNDASAAYRSANQSIREEARNFPDVERLQNKKDILV